ncbi:MAG TPA: MotA/TolQ/ExbB proton channel family protein [Candidatus Didemnitutus sp.]|jgi:biopolymer transport protein ExbB
MRTGNHLGLAVLFLLALSSGRADSIDDAMKRASLDYAERLRIATEQLVQVRERTGREKAPLLQAMRAAEDRILAAETEISRLETGQEQSAENHRKLARDSDALRKNESYLTTIAHDSLTAFSEGLLPGEKELLPAQIEKIEEQFNEGAIRPGRQRALAVADFLFGQTQLDLGGYTRPGKSLREGDNEMVDGTFAFAGPEAFFRVNRDGTAGPVRIRAGTDRPVACLLPEWKPALTADFFQGRMGIFFADASSGKALRLREAKGTLWQHVRKGGIVSLAILGVGLVALLMILQKVRDAISMAVDSPAAVERCLDAVANGTPKEAGEAVRSMRSTTRELFSAGLCRIGQSKDQLEELLYAVLLRQRLHYERWLSLLAVIATAAPLMGLLGTVTGMVRTFALITVFGTGNAGKLASGISEVLVSTELGLIVAIPTLVAHGFLSHRIHKNLSLLERYAIQFVTVAQGDGLREEHPDSIPA